MKSKEKDNIFDIIDNRVLSVMNAEPYLFDRAKEEVTIERLYSKTRYKEVVVSRQMCAYLADFVFNSMLNSNMRLVSIGERYGQKHCNIIHSKACITNYIDSEPQILHMMAQCIDDISEDIKAEKYREKVN